MALRYRAHCRRVPRQAGHAGGFTPARWWPAGARPPTLRHGPFQHDNFETVPVRPTETSLLPQPTLQAADLPPRPRPLCAPHELPRPPGLPVPAGRPLQRTRSPVTFFVTHWSCNSLPKEISPIKVALDELRSHLHMVARTFPRKALLKFRFSASSENEVRLEVRSIEAPQAATVAPHVNEMIAVILQGQAAYFSEAALYGAIEMIQRVKASVPRAEEALKLLRAELDDG